MRKLAPLLAAAALAAVAGCGGSSGSSQSNVGCTASSATATTSVSLAGTSFSPSCILVSAGSSITFTNVDGGFAHTVTTDAGQATSFDSGNLASGRAFTQAFPTAGTVRIHCTYHASMGMTATVIVQ